MRFSKMCELVKTSVIFGMVSTLFFCIDCKKRPVGPSGDDNPGTTVSPQDKEIPLMFRILLCALIAVSLLFFTCLLPNNPSDNQKPPAISDSSFIAFKLDNIQKRIVNSVFGFVDTAKGAYVTLVSGINTDETKESMSIMFSGNKIGTYGSGKNDILTYGIKIDTQSIFQSLTSSLKPVITVTRFDEAGGYIEGTFSGKVTNLSKELSITEGMFKVKHVLDTTQDTVVVNPNQNYFRVTFKGESLNLDATASAFQLCTLTTIGGIKTTSEMKNVQLVINGLTSGFYSGDRVHMVIQDLAAGSSAISAYATDTLKYDVIDSIVSYKKSEALVVTDTFVHVDSVMCTVSATMTINGPRISGTFGGELGADDPGNIALHYRLLKPKHEPVSGRFSLNLAFKRDCAGKLIPFSYSP